jgi:hypothetical protein
VNRGFSQEPGLFAERGNIDEHFEYYKIVVGQKSCEDFFTTHDWLLDEVWVPAHPQYNCQCV